MEVLECRRRFPPANNHLSCIWGLSRLDNSFSKSRAVKPPTGLMWQKKTRTPPASGFLYSAVLQASGIEEWKRILLENPIRERRKYALLREREHGNKFSPHPQAKDFDINKGKSLTKENPVSLWLVSENQCFSSGNKHCKWTGNCFHPKFS